MAEAVSIQVEARDPQKNKGTGTRVARRLRGQGRIPAIIYGHKQTPQPITIGRDDVWLMIKRGAHLTELKFDGSTEMCLVRAVQWDHLGKEIIHLDFARVSADEAIITEVPLVLHGTPPAEGGILEQLTNRVKVSCPARAIPDSIRVEIGDLHLGQAIHGRDLKLPEGVALAIDPEALLLHMVARAAAAEPTVAEPTSVEPEVIGRKAEEGKEE
jgi:large subunit ribosomal protein L25